MDKKTIILFGTGVLTNSWKPIINAINSVEIENIISTLDEANSYLTRVVYLLRYYTANNESLEITELNNLIFRIKKEIIFQLNLFVSKDKFIVQDEFENIIDTYNLNDENSFFITTNWDNYIETKFKIHSNNILYLHGNITNNFIYLPSEVSFDLFRKDEEKIHFMLAHNQLMEKLKHAETFILYGISLDPLDAELLQTLNGGLSQSNKLKHIIIPPIFRTATCQK